MLSQLTISAPAKVNLYFAVLGKRSDGYHNVETVMQKIDLVDILTFNPASEDLELTCSDTTLPVDDSNLVLQAAKSFFDYTRKKPSVCIHLEKNIPIAAGLGGGSSDAGSCLVGLNLLYKTELTQKQLFDLARPLGADVPFFITKSTATYATGIGNELHSIDPIDSCWILLVNPGVSVSTKWVYDNFRLTSGGNPYKLCGCSKSLLKGEKSDLILLQKADSTRLFNDLEEVTIKKYTVIQEIKDGLIAAGAVSALMSGSGATVFGIFDDFEAASKSKDLFSQSYSAVFLTEPVMPIYKC